ncbi:glycosyltransferase [Pseudoalteromonas sp. S1612]|uniref:glycosyltransferase family 4 protein n=1 Tax=Pseudoalteromonas sp. S1612 TaxID=579507 RepID=UPI00110C0648|nr:glycosyltransferase [Pseudoalteromonas sp. S1612]TMP54725.1 glycosyl transferase family 1 [Pseudoalteromonas sp. S1612]
MKITHVITGLNDGGAEAALFHLCKANKENEHHVISLMGNGKYGELLRTEGFLVDTLNMPQGKVTLHGLIKLFKLMRIKKPDVVQTWMYHADLVGGVIARLVGIKNINWGVHHSNLTPGDSKKTTIYIARLCSLLSFFIPKNIIFCAEKSAQVHKKIGYCSSKLKVINNGYDLKVFNIVEGAKKSIREEFDLSQDTVLLGMVSRFHPFKDHENLTKSLGLLKKKGYKFKCLLVGANITSENVTLQSWIEESDITNEVILTGSRNDIPTIMNGLDIHLLSSSSEAFPNVINEAMACGVPCITTDVGDAAIIVGATGWVVPIKDPNEFALGIVKAIDERGATFDLWQKRKEAARTRIVDNYSIEVMVKKYNEVWFDKI